MRTAIVGTEVGDGSLPDEGGIEDLYLRTVPSAVRLAFLITGDAHLAEDVGQEAFLRATGRFAHLRSPSTFDAYLRRAVVNLCMSHLRRRKVERAYLEREGRRAATSVDPPDLGERDELRAALERDAERAPLVTQAPPDVRRRVRRRQVGTGLVATATAAAAVAGAMLVAASLLRSTARPGEESPDRTRTSTVRGVTLEYPAGWTLVELADEVVVGEGRAGPEGAISGQALLQLSNFDPMASEGSLLCPDPAWGPLPDGGCSCTFKPSSIRGCPDRRLPPGPLSRAGRSRTPSGRASALCSTTLRGRSTGRCTKRSSWATPGRRSTGSRRSSGP